MDLASSPAGTEDVMHWTPPGTPVGRPPSPTSSCVDIQPAEAAVAADVRVMRRSGED